jgi:hypothetical protein
VGVPVTLRVIWPGTSEWVDLQRTVTGGKGLATGDTGNRAGTFRFSYEGRPRFPPGSSKDQAPLP